MLGKPELEIIWKKDCRLWFWFVYYPRRNGELHYVCVGYSLREDTARAAAAEFMAGLML